MISTLATLATLRRRRRWLPVAVATLTRSALRRRRGLIGSGAVAGARSAARAATGRAGLSAARAGPAAGAVAAAGGVRWGFGGGGARGAGLAGRRSAGISAAMPGAVSGGGLAAGGSAAVVACHGDVRGVGFRRRCESGGSPTDCPDGRGDGENPPPSIGSAMHSYPFWESSSLPWVGRRSASCRTTRGTSWPSHRSGYAA